VCVCVCVSEREKEKIKWGGSETLHLGGDFFISGFEGSEAVSTSPSGRGTFERG
jgi:hypothetical protein